MNASFAQATLQPLQPGEAGYDALLEAATAPLSREFGPKATVAVQRLDRIGNWAFLIGSMRDAGGGPLSLEGSRFEERAASGGMSDVYVALLKRQPDAADTASADGIAAAMDGADRTRGKGEGEWILLDHAIGPGDVAWLAWPDRHAAPRELFGF